MSKAKVAIGRRFDPNTRGYFAIYRENEPNYCPGCGRSQWILGRTSAECAFCATALPLDVPATAAKPTVWERGEGGGKVR